MRLKKEDKMASMDIIPASLRKDMEEKSEDTSAVYVISANMCSRNFLITLANVLLPSLLC